MGNSLDALRCVIIAGEVADSTAVKNRCLSFLASSLDGKRHESGQDSRFFVVSVVPSAKWVSIHDSAGWLLSFQKQKTRGHATQVEVNAVEEWSTGPWRGCFVQFCPPPGLAGEEQLPFVERLQSRNRFSQ
ncbi:hypothetical protein MG293_012657 [Ovis ammon polii]|uniref:Uncharacterized protein n=1 Tax=Ovis ammon polii TaxID=230172 RepID=A0AAD4U4F5_OVIAM|nr:hypothetical protein MG293_012657 [Ovis ammon polii]